MGPAAPRARRCSVRTSSASFFPDRDVAELQLSASERDAALDLATHPRYGEVVRHCVNATRESDAEEAAARVLGTMCAPDEALRAIGATTTPRLAVVRAMAGAELAMRDEQDNDVLDRERASAILALEALASAPRATAPAVVEALARAALAAGAAPARLIRAARATDNAQALSAVLRSLGATRPEQG